MTTLRTFPQNVIAVVWDFDKTLVPSDMHEPLFEHFKVSGKHFWEEVNALPEFYEQRGDPLVSADTLYLSHILTYVENGRFPNLDNKLLRDLGGELQFFPGMPAFLGDLKRRVEEDSRFQRYGITLEHYVVSTGLRQMICGSGVADYVEDIWACEFLESAAPPGFLDQPDTPAQDTAVRRVGYAIDSTTKTRALFEINRGINKHPEISVNTMIPREKRRVPFEHMICVADGPNDVPMFSVVKQFGGRTLAVHDPSEERDYRQVARLLDEDRVKAIGPAVFTGGTDTTRCLEYWAEHIAMSIARKRASALGEDVGDSPDPAGGDDARGRRARDPLGG